jgi:hypothetical protein
MKKSILKLKNKEAIPLYHDDRLNLLVFLYISLDLGLHIRILEIATSLQASIECPLD